MTLQAESPHSPVRELGRDASPGPFDDPRRATRRNNEKENTGEMKTTDQGQ